MLRMDVRTELDAAALAEILALVGTVRAEQGYAPLGEHKLSQLRVGAREWTGILAHEGGRLVGYAHARWNPPGSRPRAAVEVVVHPERSGGELGRDLLRAARTLVGREGGGLLYVWQHRVVDPSRTLAAAEGLRVSRELALMGRGLDEVPDVRLPHGVEVRPYRHPQDEAALLAVNNAAFAGHPENGGWGPEDLAERRALAWFDPEGLLLAWRGTQLLGFHWTKVHGREPDSPPAEVPVGEVYVLAIAPAAQGTGLGRALLHAGLAHLAGRGARMAILYVDLAEEAAVRLYTSAGFASRWLEVCYEEEVSSAAGP